MVNPETVQEWQEAVDIASALLHLDSARAYGLVMEGPIPDVSRCEEIIELAKAKGITPTPDHVERFIAAHLTEEKL